MMDVREITRIAIDWLLGSGIRIAVILVLMFVALKLAKLISRRLYGKLLDTKNDEFRKRIDTLGTTTNYLLSVIIVIVAVLMVLGEFGVKIGPLVAAAGVVGLAVSFGAQHLVQDLIGGFFILMDDQIRVGDVVEVAGRGGLVERVNLRMTVLRDLAGNVHFVRNGQIDVVTNMTKDYSRYVFDIGVAYREDVDEVIAIVREVDEELRSDPEFEHDILEPIEILGLDQFADSAVVIKARAKTRPIRQWAVGREFNRRLKKKFDERDIEFPFPHVTLYLGADKEGKASPLKVSLGDHQGRFVEAGRGGD